MFIRGARSSRRHPATEGTLKPIDLQFAAQNNEAKKTEVVSKLTTNADSA